MHALGRETDAMLPVGKALKETISLDDFVDPSSQLFELAPLSAGQLDRSLLVREPIAIVAGHFETSFKGGLWRAAFL